MKRKAINFEEFVGDGYDRFGPLAKRYYYRFTRCTVTVGEPPCMIFLGNHSSGKSSLINWVMGGSPVQDVGLAPTDDGFTVITYGEQEEDIFGTRALEKLPPEFDGLRLFGDNFLQRLRVKVRNRELLKNVRLIDTPGMIDSAEQTVDRAYNFEGVVRTLAELCDMVFFLLDPDKPGTTGETVNIFSKCLAGVEFKLRVLLNKCDAFSGMYDFARTYGTVCWNLARVLHTKDLPKIWTIYSGEAREGGKGLDLADFNRHREEFLSVFRNAAARRRDNVVSQATNDFRGLSLRMRVVNYAARKLAMFCFLSGAFGVLVSAAAAFLVGHVAALKLGGGGVLSIAAGVAAACCGLFLTYVTTRFAVRFVRAGLADKVDDIFSKVYRTEVAVGSGEDLRQAWDAIKEETAEVVRNAPLNLPLFGEFGRRRVESTLKTLDTYNKKMEDR